MNKIKEIFKCFKIWFKLQILKDFANKICLYNQQIIRCRCILLIQATQQFSIFIHIIIISKVKTNNDQAKPDQSTKSKMITNYLSMYANLINYFLNLLLYILLFIINKINRSILIKLIQNINIIVKIFSV